MEDIVTSKYAVKYCMGSGGFAQVYAAIHKKTNCFVAIKMIPKEIKDDENHKTRIQREMEISASIQHPFIIDLYEIIESEKYIYIVMEIIRNGCLTNMLCEKGKLCESTAKHIFAQLATVLRFLHKEKNIAHRDIKLENILLDDHNNIRIIDFGLSKFIQKDHLTETLCGSPQYASPEILMGQKYGFEADIWASGILLYTLVFGIFPFASENITKLAREIIYKPPQFEGKISNELIDLITKLLVKNPKERINIEEVCQHPWIRDEILLTEARLKNIYYDESGIEEDLVRYGISSSNVKADLEMNIINDNTVSYKLIKNDHKFFGRVPLLKKNGKPERKESCPACSLLPSLI